MRSSTPFPCVTVFTSCVAIGETQDGSIPDCLERDTNVVNEVGAGSHACTTRAKRRNIRLRGPTSMRHGRKKPPA